MSRVIFSTTLGAATFARFVTSTPSSAAAASSSALRFSAFSSRLRAFRVFSFSLRAAFHAGRVSSKRFCLASFFCWFLESGGAVGSVPEGSVVEGSVGAAAVSPTATGAAAASAWPAIFAIATVGR